MNKFWNAILLGGPALALASLALAPQISAGEPDASLTPETAATREIVAARQGGMVMSVFTLAQMSMAANGDKPLTGAAFPASGLAGFARSLPRLFAPDTRAVGETRALPGVWEDPTDFAAHIAEYQAATAQLEAAARKDDRPGFTAALARTKAACKACHDSYRLEP